MEGCALGARPSPAAAACQTALQAACPHAVHGVEAMQGGGLENPPSFSWRTAVERGMEGCALGSRPSPAAAACQAALQAACPHAVHDMEPMQGGGLENPPSFSWRTATGSHPRHG